MSLLRAEWTKLRTVPGLAWCLLAAAGAIAAFAVVISSGSPGTFGGAAYVDEFRFVHRPLTGDGTLVARVRTQDGGHPWAMAGILLKQSATPGAPYAALMVTPGHGVRLQSGFTTDLAGSRRPAPRWLRLTRAGATVTGYESADGTAWSTVGTVTLDALGPSAQAGLFVTSPGMTRVVPMRPALVRIRPGSATFDSVRLETETPQPAAAWRGTDVGGPADRSGPAAPDPDGAFTLTGSGDIVGRTDDGSRIVAATAGTIFGVLPIVALGALVTTSEYRGHAIRTTLAASPRRGRVLAAKAVVAGGAAFAAGLAGTALALLVSQPLLRRQGFRPPVYPDPALSDPAVWRVVAGTAAFLALVAVLGVGLGAILRRGAGTIAVLAGALLVPLVVTPFLPADAGRWVQRLAPLAGLSLQQVRESDDALLLPWAGRPWTGLAVLCGYAGLTLLLGYAVLRRRDA
ncbi:hypothetical protein [Phytohabitans rumicis]|uniref:ABC transporter n=1 Tax=Phytohabitans rumicis TaxID=1076125 RepID=A0A6V8LGF5_9ACTN|nr:hypothetical protein [Phytohabitans rumicis]GFJ96342.1 hypothetical protein Prum_099840 [Phytohabitans rumicis]